MATRSYELSRLDPDSFEHLVNALALRVLGTGHTGFGPGSDGGRDGFFEGVADYPNPANRWNGIWYIQSKFHAPHLSKDPQAWLLEQLRRELEQFDRDGSPRTWPDNWIIATNIDPSGAPETGAFDQARALVKAVNPNLARRFHIWGGSKIIDLLVEYPNVAAQYGNFITSGDVLAEMRDRLRDASARPNEILNYLLVKQLSEQRFTKLEQAGSTTDNRPGIHTLFRDLPFIYNGTRSDTTTLRELTRAMARTHTTDIEGMQEERWEAWDARPARSKVWFIRGGPGQGKSTITQYLCQIHRASLILGDPRLAVSPANKSLCEEIRDAASRSNVWPLIGRVPILVELRNFAFWFGNKSEHDRRGILSYICEKVSSGLEEEVLPGTVKRVFGGGRWLFVFDGLDEVPGDVKDDVAKEIVHFVDALLVSCDCDAATICTSRPQGYSGQFSALGGAKVDLALLSPAEALVCAAPVLSIERSVEEAQGYAQTLSEAVQSSAVREIMTTPLQAHIMAVVVRDGGRPPERKWQLFNNFYHVIKKREANRSLPDKRLSKLLRENDKLIKTLHNKLGFELHARAEVSTGAQTSLHRTELRQLVERVVDNLQDHDVAQTVDTLMEATTERLVLVNTPEDGSAVRFDIRPLQEFFAAEHLYETASAEGLPLASAQFRATRTGAKSCIFC